MKNFLILYNIIILNFDRLKALAFVPVHFVQAIYESLNQERPCNSRIEDFVKTWMNGDYPIQLQNRLKNNRSRTNNHVEGDNKKIDSEMPSENINIYQYIDFIKFQRLRCSSNMSVGNKIRNFTQKAVSQMLSVIQILKSNLVNLLNQTPPDLNQQSPIIKIFIRAIANLYQYEAKKNENEGHISDTAY